MKVEKKAKNGQMVQNCYPLSPGGGRLCYNVGSWDSELNTIIGTPGVGSSHGGVSHEWRLSNATKMTLNASGIYLNDGWFRTYGSQG